MSSQHLSPPRPLLVWGGLVLVAYLLFCRFPGTGYIFDEQEALLSNPYLHGEGSFLSAFRLDFWGLPADRSIGSYRPLPNLIWRAFRAAGATGSPFLLQLPNPLLHGTNAYLLYRLALRWSGELAVAALAGLFFVVAGVATEAVTSIVGLADLLAMSATLSCLLALSLAPLQREIAVFGLCLLGLLSKETMVTGFVPIALGTWFVPRLGSGERRPLMGSAGLLVTMLLSALAFAFMRRAFFLGSESPEPVELSWRIPWLSELLRYLGQPSLPVDGQNNPLLLASPVQRWATALDIYGSEFLQMVLPSHLCADYSFPRIVPRGAGLGSLMGALAILGPFIFVAARWIKRPAGQRRLTLLDFGLLVTPLAALPTSNLLVLLPTIRAERLLLQPLLGVALVLAVVLGGGRPGPARHRAALFLLWLSALSARAHALHYQSDVLFWRAAALGAPASAKAHLNLGVMLGARGDPDGRLRETERAAVLAPNWGLAHVYVGDALCRGRRPSAALPHYLRGLSLLPNNKALAALSLQCLWLTGEFERAYDPLMGVAAQAPEGWLAFLLREVAAHGEENGGVPEKYRPRGYNQRPGAL